MKILLAHNYYQQPGGEDCVFTEESALLESFGDSVYKYRVHNDDIANMNMIMTALSSIWSIPEYKSFLRALDTSKPEIVHFHNTFPLMSPGVYYAARRRGIPVVQTLHNYRLLCPNALFFYKGQVCEQCLEKQSLFPGIIKKCYKNSHLATFTVAAMLKFHQMLKTWTDRVDVYIALTEFARKKFIQGGLPPEKIVVKPNFVFPDLGVEKNKQDYALFVGRLSPEKGINTLLEAWSGLNAKSGLKIVGHGPMFNEIVLKASKLKQVECLGFKAITEVHQLMGRASFIIFSSEWFETFGRVAVEAFAKGTPVIASDIGAIAELVDNRRTGLLFKAGDSCDLASKIEWAFAHPQRMKEMGKEARREFELKYTARRNYEMLKRIYQMAIDGNPGGCIAKRV